MDKRLMLQQMDDFTQFCSSIEAWRADASTACRAHAPEDAKALYALAIIRAARNGTFGNDNETMQAAITALWERGHHSGFNKQSFQVVFEEYFHYW